MYRTHTCGELRIKDIGKTITLGGWVQRVRNMGGMTFLDLRDRYGITQAAFNMEINAELCEQARKLGREYVVNITGVVAERESKNAKLPTGDIEIIVENLQILNSSLVPPFTIEDNTDGGDELRMKYRYLDLRRNCVKNNLLLRHKLAIEIRNYLDKQGFVDIETPVLIKSTPEGARDFVVPSRIHPGEFYALPQSPQIFKQLLMMAGYDRYYQIVKCFRDEDLRADRQPEFTQIDCEMAFVHQKDVLDIFEGLTKHLFKTVKNTELKDVFQKISYIDAVNMYGTDKPDIRFGMTIKDISSVIKKGSFKIFDDAAFVGAICAENCAGFSRKQLDALTDFVRKPQIGAKGLVYVKCNPDRTFKSSVDKFYGQSDLQKWADACEAKAGDLLLVLCGNKYESLNQLGELRLKMGRQLGLCNENVFKPLWVVDFPLLEWNEEEKRYFAMHHPFTSPKQEDLPLLETEPGKIRANAYDLVINGVEIGGGSIRIHDQELQKEIFSQLGFTDEDAKNQFGFLMEALQYGAPPHGGIAFGFDRLVALFAGLNSIRDVIAFPKNNAGKDTMIDTPSSIKIKQLSELGVKLVIKK